MLELFENPGVVWFTVGLIFLLAELALPGLIIIFFGVGAWITALVTVVFGLSFNVQLVVFIVASIISLFFLRRFILNKKRNQPQAGKELVDEFIGHSCLVVQDILPGPFGGKVSFRGTTWNAQANEAIGSGITVRIVSKESIVLFVEPISA
ncbi:NfeD family protein [Adhaeribacter aquaticus]|uniref:NfeD family protein n=1 Tax=Adhaeribacter aquaticus TaxID=299567 RepID=UPI0003FD0543|nr:NfeD family protein [Adhaeribacter aquaticus]